MSLNKNNICIYFFIFLSSQVYSQENNEAVKDSLQIENLDEVLITATRTLRQLSSLPLPVQIVSKKDIKQSNTIRLNEILNEQTGLISVPDFGGGEGIQLQGLDSQYTLILIDGAPLIGRSAGTLDLSRISVGNIKQIEIVKGASSSLYGTEALGGVVNIITETPKYGFHSALNYRVGSFNAHDLSSTINFKKKKIGVTALVNRYSTEGYDLTNNDTINTVDPLENYTLNAKLIYDFTEDTNLLVSGRFYTQKQDFIASQTLKGASTINEWNAHVQLHHTHTNKWKSYLEFYTTQYRAEEYLDDKTGSRFSYGFFDQLMVRPEARIIYKPNNNSNFISGLGFTHESLERTSFTEKPIFNSPYAYLQYDTNPTEKTNIILGVRFDGHNEYASQLSPKVALRYKVNDKLALKSSIGYGFKAPDFRQLYFDFTNATVGYTVLGHNAVTNAVTLLQEQGQIANIIVPLSEFENVLKPESSIGINIGLDYKATSAFKIGVNVFRNSIDNLIDTKVIANKTNGQNIFSYFNIHEVYTEGLELNASWKPNKQLKLSGGYQLVYAKDKDAESAFKNGQVFARETPSSPSFKLKKDDYFGLLNRSRHMANLKLFYAITKYKCDANIRATYRSKYGLFDTNGNGYLDNYDNFVDGYTIIDLALNKTLFKNYQFGIGVDNLFNFRDTQNISNIPGRILYGKLNIQF